MNGGLDGDSRASVEAHLGECSMCRRLVSALAVTTTDQAWDSSGHGAARRFSASALESPSILADRYEFLELIGRGGMGLVIKARHRTLERDVALKLLDEELVLNEDAARRFLREARAAANLDSDHIVRVLDADLLPDGQPFIALELLHGRDLAQEIALRGPLPLKEAVHILVQACLGLAAAHAQQIVHRDIKPPNLYLAERSDGSRILKVLDFGIAKVLESATLDGPETPRGALLGTPRYMAPEQLRASDSVDVRADVWALGAVLYEMLTGAPAFEGATTHEVLSAVLVSVPRPIESVRPELPQELANILEQALEKDPAKRWESVAALAEALAPYGEVETLYLAPRVVRALQHNALSPSTPPGPMLAPTDPIQRTPPPATTALPSVPVRRFPTRWLILGVASVLALVVWAISGSPPSEDPSVPAAGFATTPATSDHVPESARSSEVVDVPTSLPTSMTTSSAAPSVTAPLDITETSPPRPAKLAKPPTGTPPPARPPSSDLLDDEAFLDRK